MILCMSDSPLHALVLSHVGFEDLGTLRDPLLNRGFTIVRDQAGAPVMRRAKVRSGQRLTAEFADGTTSVRAE